MYLVLWESFNGWISTCTGQDLVILWHPALAQFSKEATLSEPCVACVAWVTGLFSCTISKALVPCVDESYSCHSPFVNQWNCLNSTPPRLKEWSKYIHSCVSSTCGLFHPQLISFHLLCYHCWSSLNVTWHTIWPTATKRSFSGTGQWLFRRGNLLNP